MVAPFAYRLRALPALGCNVLFGTRIPSKAGGPVGVCFCRRASLGLPRAAALGDNVRSARYPAYRFGNDGAAHNKGGPGQGKRFQLGASTRMARELGEGEERIGNPAAALLPLADGRGRGMKD